MWSGKLQHGLNDWRQQVAKALQRTITEDGLGELDVGRGRGGRGEKVLHDHSNLRIENPRHHGQQEHCDRPQLAPHG